MKNLFIDTSSSHIILAITDYKQVLLEFDEINDATLSDRIFPLLIKLFKETKTDIKEISKIFVVNGPGSFTGVRVGVTIAKTMAWSLNIPVVPVSSLEVLTSTEYNGDYLIPYIDARREHVFAGIYDKELNMVEEDSHTQLSKLITKIPKKSKCVLVGYEDIKAVLEIIKPNIDILKIVNKHKDDVGVDPHTLVPNYLKLTEAEEKMKKEVK